MVELLKRSRSSLGGTFTRTYNKFFTRSEEDPSTFDASQLEGQWELNLEEEEGILDAFEEKVSKTYSLLQIMLAIQAASQAAAHLQDDIEDLERARSDQPEKDHTRSVEMLTSSFQSLRTILSKSTIPADHHLRHDLRRSSVLCPPRTRRNLPCPSPPWPHRPSPDESSYQSCICPPSMGIS